MKQAKQQLKAQITRRIAVRILLTVLEHRPLSETTGFMNSNRNTVPVGSSFIRFPSPESVWLLLLFEFELDDDDDLAVDDVVVVEDDDCFEFFFDDNAPPIMLILSRYVCRQNVCVCVYDVCIMD